MKKRKLPKKNIRMIAKAHVVFTLALFGLYIALSAIYSPDFLLSDVRNKYKALADDTISVIGTVLAPPVTPVVTGAANCTKGKLSIDLNWPADKNSYSFNISRNGSALMTGLTTPSFSDQNVTAGNSYDYVVTAIGPMGPGLAASDPITVTAPTECNVPPPAPYINIPFIDSTNFFVNNGVAASRLKRPLFSGTTNLPGAIIIIVVHSSQVITDEIYANANGYWSWRPPVDLAEGQHTLYLTVKDSLDSSRIAQSTFNFVIATKDTEGPNNTTDSSSPHNSSRQDTGQFPQKSPVESPLSFSLSLANSKVFQGKQLQSLIYIEKLSPSYAEKNAGIKYTVIDQQGNELFTLSEKNILSQGISISQDIQLPKYIKAGRYRLQAKIAFDIFNISKEAYFDVKDQPLIDLGAGVVITYPQLLSKLGTTSIIFLLLLLIWLILLAREYWTYLHAVRHVTERGLERLGMLGIKKGKGVNK